MNEVISGMKVIKMYTWEDSFATWIDKIRKYDKEQINIPIVNTCSNKKYILLQLYKLQKLTELRDVIYQTRETMFHHISKH